MGGRRSSDHLLLPLPTGQLNLLDDRQVLMAQGSGMLELQEHPQKLLDFS